MENSSLSDMARPSSRCQCCINAAISNYSFILDSKAVWRWEVEGQSSAWRQRMDHCFRFRLMAESH